MDLYKSKVIEEQMVLGAINKLTAPHFQNVYVFIFLIKHYRIMYRFMWSIDFVNKTAIDHLGINAKL